MACMAWMICKRMKTTQLRTKLKEKLWTLGAINAGGEESLQHKEEEDYEKYQDGRKSGMGTSLTHSFNHRSKLYIDPNIRNIIF